MRMAQDPSRVRYKLVTSLMLEGQPLPGAADKFATCSAP